jgi:hypothetical protein
MNTFDIARKINHMPGIKVEATIDPTLISTRVKKAAQRMIRSGILIGGHRSTARMLALQLLSDACIAVSAGTSMWGVTLYNAKLTHATRKRIVELIDAAKMIEIATAETVRKGYVRDRYERTLHELNNPLPTMRLFVYVPGIAQQIAEVATEQRSAHAIAAANALADKLDGTEPIKANIFTPV